VNRLADVLDAETDELARTMTIEMGKPLSQAKGRWANASGGFVVAQPVGAFSPLIHDCPQ
jgi:acyl-CoA reductase-like NAD-dependent aldehyde dehydrogenase